MDLDSMQRIIEQAKGLRKPIWQVVMDYDVETRMTTPEACYASRPEFSSPSCPPRGSTLGIKRLANLEPPRPFT